MRSLVPILISFLIVSLFLYSKLLPYQNKLNPKYSTPFKYINKFFTPVLSYIRRVISPFEVGNGLSIDMSQVLLLILFLIILNYY